MPSELSGAEPFSADGGEAGVLVFHGLTGTPQSVQGLAEAFAGAGFTVRSPLLPGHGTTVEDLAGTGWDDWLASAESTYREVAQRCSTLVVAGLSMGGALACWLAAEHAGAISGLVVVNPFIDPPAESFRQTLRQILDAGITTYQGIGGDVADPSSVESSYSELAIEALLSLSEGLAALYPHLRAIECPSLIFTSRVDHVVPPVSSDVLADAVNGPVERVCLERSYHTATLDYDRHEIERRAVEFALKVTAV